LTHALYALPPGLRLRAVQPLTERDGSCSLLYDLERGRLVEVPIEYCYHVAMALDTGNLDDDLIAWLAGQDVLTYDSRPARASSVSWRSRAAVDDAPLSQLDRVFFFDDEVHCRLAGLEPQSALATVQSVLARVRTGSHVVFHLATDGYSGYPRALERVAAVVRAAAGGGVAARRVDLELVTDGCGLTAERVRFLAEHSVQVRLTAPELPALDLLLGHMPERLTLSVRLDTGDRLLDLWHEAQVLGVHHLDAVKITDKPFAGLSLHESELRQFRRDLFAICDDTFATLEAGLPVRPVFEPLSRVVARHRAGRPLGLDHRLSSYLGLVAHGELFTFPARSPIDPDEDFEPQPGTSSCHSCWGRELCVRGLLAGPAADPQRPSPRADRCEFWRAEVDVGLLFFHRLQEADPGHLLGFAEGRPEPALDPFVHLGFEELKTC